MLRVGARLDVAPGEAVSAGPVWDVSRYLATDGAVYLTGPTVTAAQEFEVLVCAAPASTGTWRTLVGLQGGTSVWYARHNAGLLTTLGGQTSYSAAGASLYVFAAGSRAGTSGYYGRASAAVDASAVTLSSGSALPPGASSITVAAHHTPSLAVSVAGLSVRWVGVRPAGAFSADSRAAVSGAPLSDPRDLSAEAFTHLWPMGLVYDAGGGTYKVRDLITTDGTTDLTVVSGDLGDFPEA